MKMVSKIWMTSQKARVYNYFSFQKSSNVNAVIFSLVVGAEKEFWYSRNIVNTVRQIKTSSSSISIDDRLTFGITGSIFWVFSLQGHRFQASPIQLNTPNPALVDGSRRKTEKKKPTQDASTKINASPTGILSLRQQWNDQGSGGI